MKYMIDISIFDSASAIGNLSGSTDFCISPNIGDTISFQFSVQNATFTPSVEFTGLLKVVGRVITAGQTGEVVLSLEDIKVKTRGEAMQIIEYLERGFGLEATIY